MKPKKRFGQNFLKNPGVLDFIVNSLPSCSSVLEIGAGDGRLTKKLAKKFDKVFAVELDRDMCNLLKKIENITLLCSDFLKLKPFKVDCIVGNVPYYISSKILFRLIDWDFKNAVLMFQKEFIDKMVSNPGSSNYGRLSITSSYYFSVKKLMNVSRNNFYPVPKVDSAIVSIEKKREKQDKDFDDFIRKLFSLKNKKIKNVLNIQIPEYSEKRARHLNLEQVIDLYQKYLLLKKNKEK